MCATSRGRTIPDGDLVVTSSSYGPVADFCAGLGDLQRSSGLSRTALARELNYGRSQLYEILDGRIKRPPEWDRLVEPLIRACAARAGDRAAAERTVAEWKHRHAVLVQVCEQLGRHATVRGRRAADGGRRAALGLSGGSGHPPEVTASVPETAPSGPRSASAELVEHCAPLWPRLLGSEFVRLVSRGELTDEAFCHWMVNDHYYNLEYKRFLAGLAGIAPTAYAVEAIASGIPGELLGLQQISALSARFHIDVDAEPGPTTIGFTSFLQALLPRGYEPALAALYAAERVYFDAWSSVRATGNPASPYWPLIEHWSSGSYRLWITSLGRVVDRAAPDGATPEMLRAFERCVRFELRFWQAILDGESW